MKTRRIGSVGTLAAILVAVIASTATANPIKQGDGNDTKGPLDLGGVVVGNGGSGFEIKTKQPFDTADVGVRNGRLAGLFEILIDSNADRRFDRAVQVFYFRGRFRSVLVNRSGHKLALLKASRVSHRAVQVVVPHSKVPNQGSYDFAVLSAYFRSPCAKKHPCGDLAPNRYPLLRDDFTAPKVKWNVPKYASDVSSTLTIPVAFSLEDDPFGSGVKSWGLQERKVGTAAWVDVETGSAPSPTVNFHGVQGATYDFRVNAVDRQGNSQTTTTRVSVPYDDRNALFSYSSSTQTDSVSGAFLGTTTGLQSGGPFGQTMTFTTPFDTSDLCVLLSPTPSLTDAEVLLDSNPLGNTISEWPGSTHARDRACLGPVAGGTEVSFHVAGVPDFVFDGVILAR